MTIKSLFVNSGTIDAIRIKNRNAFIIRTSTSFKYYELQENQALTIEIDSYESEDLDRFINSLEMQQTYTAPSEITSSIITSISSGKKKDWKAVLELMVELKYAEYSIQKIEDILSELTE